MPNNNANADSLMMLGFLQLEFPDSGDCKVLDKQINLLILKQADLTKAFATQAAKVTEAYLQQKKLKFSTLNCSKNLSVEKAGQLNDIVEDYTAEDKARIESTSKKTRNIRIGIGAFVLLATLGIIIYKKRQSS